MGSGLLRSKEDHRSLAGVFSYARVRQLTLGRCEREAYIAFTGIKTLLSRRALPAL